MKWIAGGVTAAKGFQAAGVSAGMKRSRKPDLALIVADRPVPVAAVLTKNRVQAAPVLITKDRVRKGSAQAIVINSGCANCLTGDAGLQDALTLTNRVARELTTTEANVLVASTGLIGRRLPVPRMLRAIPTLVKHLSRANHTDAAQAILTTDLQVKEAAIQSTIRGRVCRVGGMAKGAGMIAPSMATMLCVVTTDVTMAPVFLRALLQEAVAETFNRVSVDGDMSTNDTVFALASGRSGVTIRRGTKDVRAFQAMLTAVLARLARFIVQDGEGAAKLMAVDVVGARNDREAQACARQIANSPLVKTMLAGGDPNVGRIAAAAGASSARFNPAQLEIAIGPTTLVTHGVALHTNTAIVRKLLARDEVHVRVNLHAGRGRGRMLSCDLTEEYVQINAGYAT